AAKRPSGAWCWQAGEPTIARGASARVEPGLVCPFQFRGRSPLPVAYTPTTNISRWEPRVGRVDLSIAASGYVNPGSAVNPTGLSPPRPLIYAFLKVSAAQTSRIETNAALEVP